MKKQILVSGLRATSEPHIGNYLGAIKQFIEKQDDYDCYFFIADLHTLTTPFQPEELRKSSWAVLADYIALGLDPKKSTIFLQSQVPQHTELAWIFNCITPVSELQRMTQFKDKASGENIKNINAGLLNYPVLMAADVLLYKGEVVPVGEDQVQHLELSRVIARKFNNAFGKTFPEPKPILNKTAKIMSLSEPTKKMSKTGGSGILLADSPEEIKKKLKKAVTATDAKGKSEGVDNLMRLLKEFGSEGQYEFFQSQLKDNAIQFSHLKDALAEAIANHFAEFREKRAKLLADPEYLAEVLAEGSKKAQSIANKTIQEIKGKIGLL